MKHETYEARTEKLIERAKNIGPLTNRIEFVKVAKHISTLKCQIFNAVKKKIQVLRRYKLDHDLAKQDHAKFNTADSIKAVNISARRYIELGEFINRLKDFKRNLFKMEGKISKMEEIAIMWRVRPLTAGQYVAKEVGYTEYKEKPITIGGWEQKAI